MNIVLIGYRGSGKSSIGRILAARTGREFLDTDELIVKAAGCTIKEIFASEGEAGFRAREAAAIQQACVGDEQVIAAGGGAILNPHNVAAFKNHGTIIWLKAPPEVLYARILADAQTTATRPNLSPKNPRHPPPHLPRRRRPRHRRRKPLRRTSRPGHPIAPANWPKMIH
jgi:shikimate kinase